jgi:hypothetical protein
MTRFAHSKDFLIANSRLAAKLRVTSWIFLRIVSRLFVKTYWVYEPAIRARLFPFGSFILSYRLVSSAWMYFVDLTAFLWIYFPVFEVDLLFLLVNGLGSLGIKY